MSAITIGGDLIHFEKLGRGRPVILVHGWVGSWRYWIPVMQQLHLKFTVYTLDLLGFGDSAKNPARYTVEFQVKMLEQFLDQLAIDKAAFLGHGLGTLVLKDFALKNPSQVARMMLTSVPLYDPGNLDERVPAGTRQKLTSNSRYSLAPQLEDNSSDRTVPSGGNANNDATLMSGRSMNEMPTIQRLTDDTDQVGGGIDRDKLRQAAEERRRRQTQQNPLHDEFKNTDMMTLLGRCFNKSESSYEKLKADVEKADDRVLRLSTQNYEAGEMLDDLRRITAPIVAVHGKDDPILPDPKEAIWNYLTYKKEDVFVPIPMPDVRHFPMLESDSFPRLAMDFLGTPNISDIEVRERWRRRNR